MKKLLKKDGVGLAAMLAVTLGGLVATSPAEATVVNWSCITSGETGEWKATGYKNGRFWWDGPPRFWRSTAIKDCNNWLKNPYQD